MKKMLIAVCFLFIACCSSAQTTSFYDSLLHQSRQISRSGMRVLSAWGTVNLVGGLVGYHNNIGSRRQFYKTAAIFGGVNLLIGGATLLSLRGKHPQSGSPQQTAKQLQTAQKLFLFNTGLDVAYVVFGAYLLERGNRFSGDKRSRIKGTGSAFILQGSFLTLFDGWLFLRHNKNATGLNSRLAKLELGTSADGLMLAYRF